MSTTKVPSNAQKIRDYIAKHPNATAKGLATRFSVRISSVYQVIHKLKMARTLKEAVVARHVAMALAAKAAGLKTTMPVVVDTVTGYTPQQTAELAHEVSKGHNRADMVNHQPHYKMGGIETIDFIEAKALGFHLGNVVKYITRADHKGNKLEDLQKAQFYLRRAIELART